MNTTDKRLLAKNEKERVKRKIDYFMNIKNPPEFLHIEGLDKPLTAIMDNFVGNWIIKEANKIAYRQKWDEFLPLEIYNANTKKYEVYHKKWSVAYPPQIALRKVIPEIFPTGNGRSEKLIEWPYFINGKNTARDDRPQMPVPEGEDILQKNVIENEMIIGNGGENFGFYICPNGFPFHKYSSILISKEFRPQKNVTEKDLEDWLKFSFLTKQIVFFNPEGGGASRPERFHAQVVDPEVLYLEGKVAQHPIINENIVKKIHIANGISELINYPAPALIFSGRDAATEVSKLIKKAEEATIPCSIIVRDREIYVIARCRGREISHCIGKRIGGYELDGIIFVGNVEEPVLGQLGLEKMIHADDVFNALDYETIHLNILAACMPVEILKGWAGISTKK